MLRRASSQSSISLSSHPIALVDKRRGAGKRSSFTIRHVFRDASGEVAAEGTETRIWARKEGDARSLKAIAIPEDVKQRLGG